MESRVAFSYCDEEAPTGGGYATGHFDMCINGGAVGLDRGDLGPNEKLGVDRGRALEGNGELGGDRARRLRRAGEAHQVPSRGPVRVAVEHGSANASVEHIREREVIGLGAPPTYASVVALRKAPDVKPVLVGWATAEADGMWPVDLLQAPRVHASMPRAWLLLRLGRGGWRGDARGRIRAPGCQLLGPTDLLLLAAGRILGSGHGRYPSRAPIPLKAYRAVCLARERTRARRQRQFGSARHRSV
jgi:hypothetical protein